MNISPDDAAISAPRIVRLARPARARPLGETGAYGVRRVACRRLSFGLGRIPPAPLDIFRAVFHRGVSFRRFIRLSASPDPFSFSGVPSFL